ncbi:ribonuclease H-like domain-containing protein [Mycena rebaudengoi]|nr:ribonuclease H-like domain-containing protein [Mycena rebaudengoi]
MRGRDCPTCLTEFANSFVEESVSDSVVKDKIWRDKRTRKRVRTRVGPVDQREVFLVPSSVSRVWNTLGCRCKILRPHYKGSTQQSSGWNAANQAEFGEDLCKLFVTCGWSWNDANNPEFKLFFDKYLPFANIPDRRVLSGPILTGEANKVIVATRQKIEGEMATYVEDGWKNVAHTHVDTSVLCVETQPYLLKTHDMTGHPKTGDELFEIMKSDFKYAEETYGVEIIAVCTDDFEIMKSDFKYAEETYGVEIIAVCTDDGPDGKKARRLIKAWRCSIAVFECWAHQSSFMTGNYLAIKAPWMKDAKEALEVVKWFNNHGKALDLLRAQQSMILCRRPSPSSPCGDTLDDPLLLPPSCQETRARIQGMCCDARGGTSEEQITAAESVIATCNRPSFWVNIGRIVEHLEPLAIAANVLQAPDCRLDTVLLTLANLFRIFNNLATEDAIVKKTMHASLERRWGKTDQELMILAVFFNPYLRARSFKRDVLPANKIFHLVRRAFQRLLGQDAAGDIEFLDAFREYYNESGDFTSDSMWLEGYADYYKKAKKTVDLVGIWKSFEGESRTGRSGFVKLAIRILSILPNSAGAERVFSVFGLTHMKHRNRLEPQKVHDATTVRMDRQKAHIAAGLTIARKARRFSLADDEPQVSVTEAIDFDTMADNLISLINEDDTNEDLEITPQASSTHPNPPPTAADTVTSATTHIPAYKRIKLADLFNYPSKDSPAAAFEFFWQGGRGGVDAEEEELANEASEAAPSVGAAEFLQLPCRGYHDVARPTEIAFTANEANISKELNGSRLGNVLIGGCDTQHVPVRNGTFHGPVTPTQDPKVRPQILASNIRNDSYESARAILRTTLS